MPCGEWHIPHGHLIQTIGIPYFCLIKYSFEVLSSYSGPSYSHPGYPTMNRLNALLWILRIDKSLLCCVCLFLFLPSFCFRDLVGASPLFFRSPPPFFPGRLPPFFLQRRGIESTLVCLKEDLTGPVSPEIDSYDCVFRIFGFWCAGPRFVYGPHPLTAFEFSFPNM